MHTKFQSVIALSSSPYSISLKNPFHSNSCNLNFKLFGNRIVSTQNLQSDYHPNHVAFRALKFEGQSDGLNDSKVIKIKIESEMKKSKDSEASFSNTPRVKKRTAIFDIDQTNSSTEDFIAEDVQEKMNEKFMEDNREGSNKKKVEGRLFSRTNVNNLFSSIVAFVTPRQHGDIRDIILVCLSFSVMVYISQKMVSAYMMLFFFPTHY